MTITLDGRITGPGGNEDMEWILPHAFSDVARDFLSETSRRASTAIMGSVNADGFAQAWPPVARDLSADPRDRDFAIWLNRVEKHVLTSRGKTPWADARVHDISAVSLIDTLEAAEGDEILILNSVSVMMPLFEADRIDRLDLLIVPEILGAGRRLFECELPAASWELQNLKSGDTGAIATRYVRNRHLPPE